MLRKLQKNPQKTEIAVKMKKRGKSAKNRDRGKNGKTAKKAQNTAIAGRECGAERAVFYLCGAARAV